MAEDKKFDPAGFGFTTHNVKPGVLVTMEFRAALVGTAIPDRLMTGWSELCRNDEIVVHTRTRASYADG